MPTKEESAPPKKTDDAQKMAEEKKNETALLIHPILPEQSPEKSEERLLELDRLSRTAGLIPKQKQTLKLSNISPSHLLGRGLVEEIAEYTQQNEIDVLVINQQLTPVQQRNLERSLKIKVVDRTVLILEIFATRARTREGKMQVALASLLYQQSRLVRTWTHLERQRGGVGLRGGPGEAQIEVDRRLIRQRIQKLKKSLQQVKRTRTLQRHARQKAALFTIALVGYTNAGKSTLFNLLTQASVLAEDKLFATLDPTLRCFLLPHGQQAALCDTVGFVKDLPHQLVAAFHATLEEVQEADLLLKVVDAEDREYQTQLKAVDSVLKELDAHKKPFLILFNKIDALNSTQQNQLKEHYPDALMISAHTGEGIPELLDQLTQEHTKTWKVFHLTIPFVEGAFLAKLHQKGKILLKETSDNGYQIDVSLPNRIAGQQQEKLSLFRRLQI
ncbi:GTPase HflX [Magnetococcales bacterium HHB-1]